MQRRWLSRVAIASCLVVAFGYLAFRYLVWPHAHLWHERIEAALSQRLGQPLRAGSITADFEGLSPRLVASAVTIGPQPQASIERIDAVLSWRTLPARELRLKRLVLDGAKITIERQSERGWRIAGLSADLGAARDSDERALDLLLAQPSISVRNGTLRLIDRIAGVEHVVAGVAARLERDGARHRLRLDVAQAGPWLRDATLMAEAVRRDGARGAGAWRADAQLHVAGLQLAALQPLLHDTVLQGEASAQATMQIDAGRIVFATLELRGPLRARTDADELRFDHVDAALRVQRVADGWQLDVSRLLAQRDHVDAVALDPRGAQVRFDEDGTPRQLALALQSASLRDLAALLRVTRRPEAAAAWLAAARVSGAAAAVELKWQRDDTGRDDFALAAQLRDLHWQHPESPLARIENGRGRIGLARQRGDIALEADTVGVRWRPAGGEETALLQTMRAVLDWQADPTRDAITVRVQQLALDDPRLQGSVHGLWRRDAAHGDVVDLSAQLQSVDLHAFAAHAAGVLPRGLHEAAAALRSGRLVAAHGRLAGELGTLLAAPERAQFSLAGSIEALELAAAGLPALTGGRGRIELDPTRASLQVEHAQVDRLRVEDARLELVDWTAPQLRAAARVSGELPAMLALARRIPPLRPRLAALAPLRLGGGGSLELQLEHARGAGAPPKVRADLRLHDASAGWGSELPPVTGVRGTVQIREDAVQLDGISGRWLGGPLAASGRLGNAGGLRLDGQLAVASVRALVDVPLIDRLGGRASYAGRIRWRRNGPEVQIDSDLRGLTSELPAPLGKSAEQAWPLKVALQPSAQRGRFDVSAHVGPAQARFEGLRWSAGRAQLDRGVIAIGTEPVLPADGVAAIVQAADIDADRWA
ncbi:MAG TPA: DUF3971 domain-containing protein, partial [Burkholderiaceae bacterium]|nr:DUF3971 domain-containing protein [Burkholderiaceae bacterium]